MISFNRFKQRLDRYLSASDADYWGSMLTEYDGPIPDQYFCLRCHAFTYSFTNMCDTCGKTDLTMVVSDDNEYDQIIRYFDIT